jgi:DegV family protein with EDD domain
MIRIMTDSTSDLLPQRREALGVDVLPLSVHFGQETFQDGVDITNQGFYERLAQAETLPTTSQVNPEVFADLFQHYVDQGDQMVGIFISSDLSGTFQSAAIARDMVEGGEIYVIDSRSVTFALGLLVEQAASLRDQGLSAAQIADQVTRLTSRLRLLAVVDTLKYLKMGGRISAATAVVGGILGISPIISVQDGKVEAVGKARGRKAALQWMAKRMEQEPAAAGLPVAFGHSNAPKAMEECMDFFSARLEGTRCFTGDIGAVVGTHAGPGATGIAYFAAE